MDAQKVYILQHSYEYGKELEHDETKFIGVYSALELAEQAIARLKDKEGFRDYPIDCFYIDEYPLDKDHWVDGFFDADEERQI